MKEQINAMNSLAHTKWNCKYHIVFAMICSITHHCANSIKADYCSIWPYRLKKSQRQIFRETTCDTIG